MAVRVQLHSRSPITPVYTPNPHTHTVLVSLPLQRRQDANPSTSSIDWWPYPPNGVSTTSAAPTANTPSTSSPAPILISIISNPSNETSPTSLSPMPTSIMTSPTSNNTTILATGAPSRTSSVSSALSSSAGTPASNSGLSATHGSFTLMDIVPAFAVVGAILLGVLVWVIYGCCTRKPRFHDIDDDGELICGPPYVNEYHHPYPGHRDLEETGHDGGEDIDIESAPLYEARNTKMDYNYRWPSLSQQPVFPAVDQDGDKELDAGFYVPSEYMAEDAPLISVGLVAVPSSRSQTLTKVTNIRRTMDSKVASRAARYAGLSRGPSASRVYENALGDSDAECDAGKSFTCEDWGGVRMDKEREKEKVKQKLRLREREVEQEKEKEAEDAENNNNSATWFASLRNTIAEGSLRLIQGGRTGSGADKARELNPFATAGAERSAGKSDASEDYGNIIGNSRPRLGSSGHSSRRRGHARADSDVLLPLPAARTSGSGSSSVSASTPLAKVMPQSISKPTPEAHLPPVTPRGRRTFAPLKDGDEVDKFTPAPARLSESRSPTRDRSRSRGYSQCQSRDHSPSMSMSPRKSRHTRDSTSTTQGMNTNRTSAIANAIMSPRNVLPQSPPRVTSPPLESAMCFTPIPPLAAQLGSPSPGPRWRSDSRSRSRGYSLVDDSNYNSDWRRQPRANNPNTRKDFSTSTPWRHGKARDRSTDTPTKIPGVGRRRDTDADVHDIDDKNSDKSTRARVRSHAIARPPPPPANAKSPRVMPLPNPPAVGTRPARTQAHPRVGRAPTSASASSSTSSTPSNSHSAPSAFESATRASANPSANKLRRNTLVRQ